MCVECAHELHEARLVGCKSHWSDGWTLECDGVIKKSARQQKARAGGTAWGRALVAGCFILLLLPLLAPSSIGVRVRVDGGRQPITVS